MSTIPVSAAWYLDFRKKHGLQPLYLERMHEKQRAFATDKARRASGRCGRRAGKTRGVAGRLLNMAESHPGERSVYITLTRSRSRQIMWDGALERMMKEMRLPLQMKTRDGQLMVEHVNGSSIWLAGCDNKSEIDKFRGERFACAAIDEAQAFPDWIESLVEDALWPALGDLRGPLALTGTPSATCAGYFFEVTTGLREGYSIHHWDCRSNPYLADAEELFADALARYGTPDHPTFKREWLGEWVDDPEALVYPIRWQENSWTPETLNPYGLPDGDYTYGLGVDIGFGEGSTAFVFAAARRGTGQVYLLRAWVRSRLTPTALAAHVAAVRDQHAKETGKGLTIVMDEGALGKGYAQQARELGVACEAAEKSHKRSYQEYVRGLIMAGQLKCHFGECAELLDETRKLQFDPETNEEDEAYRRHVCDAMLYICRRLFPRYDPKHNDPPPGTPEALRLEMERHKIKFAKELARKQRERS